MAFWSHWIRVAKPFALHTIKPIGASMLNRLCVVGAWLDPDMLQIDNGGLTHVQEQSHFALWAVVKAPLLIGNDLTNISPEALEILSNEEVRNLIGQFVVPLLSPICCSRCFTHMVSILLTRKMEGQRSTEAHRTVRNYSLGRGIQIFKAAKLRQHPILKLTLLR